MTKVENRAWFLSKDGRAPLYFHVMYDEDKSGVNRLDFTKGQYINLGEKKCVYFYVEHEGKYADKHRKYANRDYVMKWDFLPQSVSPIANKKALKLLEKEAPGEFQAIPVKILLPDGSYIEEYTLINPLNELPIFLPEKSVISKNQLPFKTSHVNYKTHFYNKYGLNNKNIAVDKLQFFGSEKLRLVIKKEKLVGLQFKNTYGTSHFFLDETSINHSDEHKNIHRTKNPNENEKDNHEETSPEK
ncbi:hypothetical protein N3Z17_04720 [Candidatus Bandiella numerosa]|uniref:hypothetical protein n=1 Tax=Candidatus Bandiella numerosa TaxID=2570586 RepID=UPI00249DABCA|nr:hypothetical protein [Candidatus Bandiella numerosa]WHA04526.1 hypothetical protein N3Z17_04720 [Candidatus Bandiella numerosa]